MSQRALQLIQQEKDAKTGYLDLSERNEKQKPSSEKKSQNNRDKNLLNKIPTAISNLVNLKKLVISNHQITKLENLPQNISQLYIRSNQISKLENLPQSISQLYISRNQISKLENLPQSISQLYIHSNQITKLENLPQSISQLYIRHNKISILENLPQNISQLDISYNKISKLENLPQSISQLDISNNKINELENLPRSISKIDISNNKINNLSPLIPFVERGLEYKIKGNTINHDLEFAKYLIAKEKAAKTGYLNIERCGLTPDNPQLPDIWKALSKLTHLETLVLTNKWDEYDKKQSSQNNGEINLLDKIPKAIADLVNLKHLTIRGPGKISKIKNLPQNLSTLDISNNQITKIENLPQNLSTLNISNNQISKLENLNLPDSLTKLNIEYNPIKDLKPLLPYIAKGLEFGATISPKKYPPDFAKVLIAREKTTKTGFLDLGNCGLTRDNPKLHEIWDALSELTHLKTLVMVSEWRIDGYTISRNGGYKNLLDKIPTAIAQLVNLECLVVGERSKGIISKIENLPQSLSRLDISNNQISDLAPLIPFIEKGLDYNTRGNPIKYTPTFAKYLIAKEKVAKKGYLNLECCGLHPDAPQMRDIWNALSELTHLETLVLGNPTAIGSLVNLKSLTIRGQAGKGKISKIENLPQNLSTLDISNNQIAEIENLPQKITELHIENNEIFKIKNLPENLSMLDVSDNQISKIENLPQNLSVLNVSDNQITEIENLPDNLSSLFINNNQISKVENLPDNLNRFSIRNNQIKDLEPLLPFIEKSDFYDFNDNLIENLPPEVVEKGNAVAAIFAFSDKK